MARQIVWNRRASEAFDNIVNFLEKNISEKEAAKFVIRVDNLLEKLSQYPEIGRKTKHKKTIRHYRIDKNRKLYYRKKGKKIIIVLIFDERRNPDSNPYQ